MPLCGPVYRAEAAGMRAGSVHGYKSVEREGHDGRLEQMGGVGAQVPGARCRDVETARARIVGRRDSIEAE